MPIRSTQSLIYAESFSRAVVAAFKTNPAAALMPTLVCHLIQDEDLNPTPETLLADFTAAEADFTDYAAKAVTLTEPANVGPDVEGAVSTVNWNMTTDPPVVTNTIYGYYLVADGDLVASEMFPAGQQVEMANLADFLILNLAVMVQNFQSLSA